MHCCCLKQGHWGFHLQEAAQPEDKSIELKSSSIVIWELMKTVGKNWWVPWDRSRLGMRESHSLRDMLPVAVPCLQISELTSAVISKRVRVRSCEYRFSFTYKVELNTIRKISLFYKLARLRGTRDDKQHEQTQFLVDSYWWVYEMTTTTATSPPQINNMIG